MTTKEKINWRIVVTGMVCMTLVEMLALSMGHNGTLLKVFLVIMSLGTGIVIPLDKIILMLKGGK